MGQHCPDHNWYIIGSSGAEKGFLLYGKEDLEVTQYFFFVQPPWGEFPGRLLYKGSALIVRTAKIRRKIGEGQWLRNCFEISPYCWGKV